MLADGKPVKCCRICPDNDAPRPAKKPATIQVPEPPALSLAPASPRAIVTVAAGRLGAELLAISRPFFEAYAKRLGTDFVVLDWPGDPRWPISAKFAIPRALDHYERVVFLDADTLVPATAPDLFAMCEPDEFGAYDDLPEVLKTNAGLVDEYQRVREGQELPRVVVPYHLNTGVMVLSKQHRDVFAVPPKPIQTLHCAEQHWVNARLFDLGVKVKRLPQVCNWQWWSAAGIAAAPPDAVVHFSGMMAKDNRLGVMQAWAEALKARQKTAVNF